MAFESLKKCIHASSSQDMNLNLGLSLNVFMVIY